MNISEKIWVRIDCRKRKIHFLEFVVWAQVRFGVCGATIFINENCWPNFRWSINFLPLTVRTVFGAVNLDKISFQSIMCFPVRMALIYLSFVSGIHYRTHLIRFDSIPFLSLFIYSFCRRMHTNLCILLAMAEAFILIYIQCLQSIDSHNEKKKTYHVGSAIFLPNNSHWDIECRTCDCWKYLLIYFVYVFFFSCSIIISYFVFLLLIVICNWQ